MSEHTPASTDAAPTTDGLSGNLPFRFNGDAAEYFGIWIVNLFLTIVTLGIYSAWAKVRKKRYFYAHTWLAGSNFEYHGNPWAILKGRVIAVILFGGYAATGHFQPGYAEYILLGLVLLAPWFVVRSMAFNAHNSSYRNLRFRFRAGYKDGFMAIWPLLLVPVSALLLPDIQPGDELKPTTEFWIAAFVPGVIGLLVYPYVVWRVKHLQGNHSAFGASPFSFECGAGPFYKIYFSTYFIAAGALFLFGISVALLLMTVVGVVLVPFAYLLAGAAVFAYTRARVANLTFSSLTLAGDARFVSTLSALELAKLYFINLVVITFTLGLMIPWAAVRVARYRADNLALVSPRPVDEFVALAGQDVSAAGEEVGEMFDVDLSL